MTAVSSWLPRLGSIEGFDRGLLAPMIVGAVLNPVNSSIIAVSLIPIGVAFGAPPTATAWLVSALYVATAIGQPVTGRLIDILGPRRVYLVAAGIVGVAGVIGTLASSLGMLIVARVVLGFGTCGGYPAAMALIRDEARRTGRESSAGVLTLLAVSTQTVAVVGPPLGGLLIGLGGWRTTLAVNVPLAVVALVLGAWRLPETPRQHDNSTRITLDYPGMVLFAGMLVALLLFVMDPQATRWYLAVLAVAAGVGFAVRELRTADPFIDLRVLGGNLPLLATYARALLTYVVSYAFLYGYTQWLEDGRGLSASQAGLLQLPLFATGVLVVGITGRRKELRGKLLVGAISQILVCALLLALTSGSGLWLLVLVAFLAGVPQGLNSLALQNSLYHQADPERIGASAGLLRTFMYLGAILASAAQGAFYGLNANTVGLHSLAVFLLVMGGMFLAITLADRSLHHISTQPAPTLQ